MPGAETPTARLGRSLDRVHALLRSGDLATLPEAAAATEADLAALAGGGLPPSATELSALRAKLERNALCLKGAARGIRAAKRRIAEVRGAATGLGTYDALGQRVCGPSAPATLARRF